MNGPIQCLSSCGPKPTPLVMGQVLCSPGVGLGPGEGLGEPVLVFPWGLACHGWGCRCSCGLYPDNKLINGGRAFLAPGVPCLFCVSLEGMKEGMIGPPWGVS